MERTIRDLASRPVLVALLGELIVAVVDFATGVRLLTTMYLLPVVAVGLIETGPRTALLGAVAVSLSLASGAWDHYLFTAEHLFRLVVVAVVATLSTIGAVFRCRAVRSRDG